MLSTHLWFFYALAAAICWGFGYNFQEQAMKRGLSPAMLILLECLLVLPFYYLIVLFQGESLKNAFSMLQDKSLLFFVVMGAFTIIGGNFLILLSVNEKNASLSSLIEISYPFFVIIVAWLFFKEIQVNLWSLAGGGLIFSGVALIYLKS